MKTIGIDHVAINVRDLAASLSFYTGVMGFRQLETVPMDGFTITYLAVPGGGRMELFDYGNTKHDPARGETEEGLRHLAFSVDSVEGVEKMLRGRGVKIVLPTTDLPSLGARVLLFLDPNGVTLEYCQELK